MDTGGVFWGKGADVEMLVTRAVFLKTANHEDDKQ